MKVINQIVGVVIFVQCILMGRIALLTIDLLKSLNLSNILQVGLNFIPWLLMLVGALFLIVKKRGGLYILLAAWILSFIGATFLFMPFIGMFLPQNPFPSIAWVKVINLLVIVFIFLIQRQSR